MPWEKPVISNELTRNSRQLECFQYKIIYLLPSLSFFSPHLWPPKNTQLPLNFLENSEELPLCRDLVPPSHQCRRHCSSFFSADVNCSDGHLLYVLCHMAKHFKNTKRWNEISSIHPIVRGREMQKNYTLYVLWLMEGLEFMAFNYIFRICG